MNIQADITNKGYTGDEQIIVHEFSGAIEDLPQSVTKHLTLKDAHELNAGDWITIIDGEVVNTGEFHPYHINVESQSLDKQIDEVKELSVLTDKEYDTLADAAAIIRRHK